MLLVILWLLGIMVNQRICQLQLEFPVNNLGCCVSLQEASG